MGISGKRVLIVEDELLVALGLEDNLKSLGHDILGPVATLSEAVRMAETVDVDVAILDVNLRGEYVYPAAQILLERGIPFIFCSGFSGAMPVPGRFSDAPRVPKPYTSRAIAKALEDILNRKDEDHEAAFIARPERRNSHV